MRFTKVSTMMVMLTALVAPAPAWAWGKTGHRVTAAIAEDLLSPTAKSEIRRLLGRETLSEAAVWPDFMRSHRSVFWRKTSPPLHYVTVPTNIAYSDTKTPVKGDAVTGLARFTADLKNPETSKADKARAVKFIIHIIGDLHQPLHAGRPGDAGGNRVKVTYFGERTNLHRLWDSDMIKGEQLSFSEYAGLLKKSYMPPSKAALAEFMVTDPTIWIAESKALRANLYPETKSGLGYDYFFAHRDTVRNRLWQGGVRIAAYLNMVFAPQ